VSGARARVLMPVYNPVDYDGRVQRAAAALGQRYEVTVLSVDSGRTFAHPDFQVRTVRLPEDGARPGLHLRFLRALLRTAGELRPDVVHAHDFFMAFPGWLAARTAGARFVYDAHELIFPEPGVPQSARERVWYGLERMVVRRADLVIAANAFRAGAMREHYGLRRTPLVVQNIPPALPPALPDDALLARYPALRRGAGAAVRLVYQGDMSLGRGVGAFIEAMRALPPEFDLVLVGGGPDLERMQAVARELGVGERVRFLGRVPRADLHLMLGACDVGLISYPQTGLNNLYCAPNKLYEYTQAGLPVFARENPVLREVMEQYGVGVVSDDVAASLVRMAAGLEQYRARIPAFLAAHRWEGEAARLVDAYAGLAGTPAAPLVAAGGRS
jgi:glycosyltransferase involved in cell wall biosynthesis